MLNKVCSSCLLEYHRTGTRFAAAFFPRFNVSAAVCLYATGAHQVPSDFVEDRTKFELWWGEVSLHVGSVAFFVSLNKCKQRFACAFIYPSRDLMLVASHALIRGVLFQVAIYIKA